MSAGRIAGGSAGLIIAGSVSILVLVVIFGAGGDIGVAILMMLVFVLVTIIGQKLKTTSDPWLPTMLVVGLLAKILGATARYLALVHVFGVGDANGYHTFAEGMAPFMRDFDMDTVLGSLGNRGFGTNATKVAITALYVPWIPPMYGGFVELASLSFLGQIGFYTAFRRWVPADRLKPYAALLFFFPTLLFWPSSLGKDAFMLGALGIAAAGLSAALQRYKMRDLLLASFGMTVAVLIRPHVALLLLGAVFIAMIFGKVPNAPAIRGPRSIVLVVLMIGLVIGAPKAISLINVELTSDGIEDLIERQADNTNEGDSAVQGEAITSPTQFPAAALRVMFRPLPNEARSLEMLASSLESLALLLLLLALAPRMAARLRRSFRNPWVIACGVYILGFIVAFSTVLNLGILSRQRAQVLPFLLALIVALGWHGESLWPISGRRQSRARELTGVS